MTTPSLDDIALFVEVARRKHFSRAAETSGVPVSTLSRRIGALEERIGVKLFNRTTRRMELTPAGAVYFERCQHIVDEARIAHEQLIEGVSQPKGRLRALLPASFAVTALARLLPEFCARYPDIRCEFDLGIHAVDLVTDPYDLVLRFGQPRDSSLVAHRLESVELGLYASGAYIAHHGLPRIPMDLVDHQCLRTSTDPESTVWALHSGHLSEAVTVSSQVTANNVSMLHQLCLLGMGIAPLSRYFLQVTSGNGPLVRILPKWSFRPIPLMAILPSRLIPTRVRVFVDFLATRLPQLQKEPEAAYARPRALTD